MKSLKQQRDILMKSKRTLALEFSSEAKEEILNRDKGCILCGSNKFLTYAHYISRAKGGLGIARNGVMLCMRCHDLCDHSIERNEILDKIRGYLKGKYPEWNEEELRYKK